MSLRVLAHFLYKFLFINPSKNHYFVFLHTNVLQPPSRHPHAHHPINSFLLLSTFFLNIFPVILNFVNLSQNDLLFSQTTKQQNCCCWKSLRMAQLKISYLLGIFCRRLFGRIGHTHKLFFLTVFWTQNPCLCIAYPIFSVSFLLFVALFSQQICCCCFF